MLQRFTAEVAEVAGKTLGKSCVLSETTASTAVNLRSVATNEALQDKR